MTPALFLSTEPLRALLSPGRPRYAAALARDLGRPEPEVRDTLDLLEQQGLVERWPKGYALTSDGEAIGRRALPPPGDEGEIRWIAEAVRALSAHHGIEPCILLHAQLPAARRARARLAFAIYGRGWSPDRIDRHLGLTPGSARDGIERWRRARRDGFRFVRTNVPQAPPSNRA